MPTPVGTPSTLTGQSVSELSFSHDSGGGADRILLVKVAFRNSADIITGITYAGASLTQLSGSPLFQTAGGNIGCAIWYKVAPATGSNTVVVSFSAANNCCAGAETFSDVHQSVPFGNTVTDRSNGPLESAGSVVISSATDELPTCAIAVGQGTGNTPVAGDTSVYSVQSGPLDGTGRCLGSSRAAGAASVELDWSWSTDPQGWAEIGVSLKPAGGDASTLMGGSMGM